MRELPFHGFKKNYDFGADSYATSWTDLNVACEACHGPGSRHVAWAEARAAAGSRSSEAEPNQPETSKMGFTTRLEPASRELWHMNPATGIAQRSERLNSQELDICAGCHARRTVIAKESLSGAAFLDAYLPPSSSPGSIMPMGRSTAKCSIWLVRPEPHASCRRHVLQLP